MSMFGPLILAFLRWRRIRQDTARGIAELEAFLRSPLVPTPATGASCPYCGAVLPSPDVLSCGACGRRL